MQINLNYHIGRYYRYPGHKQKFKLKSVKSFVFHFDCGHWCTDIVFRDLIDTNTGIKVFENTQMKLF